MRKKSISIKFSISVFFLVVIMIISSLVSLYTFHELQSAYERISKIELPILIAAADLAQEANVIANNAQNLAATKNQITRKAINDKQLAEIENLKLALAAMETKNLNSTFQDRHDHTKVADDNLKRLEFTFFRLNMMVERRITAEKSFNAALKIAKRFNKEIHKIIKSTIFSVDKKPKSSPSVEGMSKIQQRLLIKWVSNIQKLASLLLSLSLEDKAFRLQKISEELRDLLTINQGLYARLSDGHKTKLQSIEKIAHAFVNGPWNLIERRKKTLDLRQKVKSILKLNRKNMIQFVAFTEDLHSHILEKTIDNNKEFNHLLDVRTNQIFMFIAGIITVGILIILYLHWAIVYRLKKIKSLILNQVGKKGEEIVHGKYDEISEMSHVIKFFQDEIDVREKSLTQAVNDAQQLAFEAETANKAKTTFLANMSHELRTPLNAIIGFSDIIKSGIKPGSEVEYAEDIFISGTHLASVINNILEFSKIDAGQQQILPEWADLGRVAQSIDGFFKITAVEKNVELKYNLPENSVVWGDEIALKQILVNFISNAIKFSDKGGTIEITGRRDEKLFYLSVRDQGIGISKDQLENVLMPFHQEDTEYSKPISGTGLGLPIAKQLVEQHGGTLEIDSKKDVGTVVTATFPLAPPDDSPDNELNP